MAPLSFVWLILASVLICFPDETHQTILMIAIKSKIFVVNCILLASAFVIYLRITWALQSKGLKVPRFKFTPIEQRSDV